MIFAQMDEHTQLRLLQPRDAWALFEFIQRERTALCRYDDWCDQQHSADDVGQFIAQSLDQLSADDGFWLGIWQHGQIAGAAGYNHMDYPDAKTEIDLWTATHTLQAPTIEHLTRHALEKLQLNRVEIQCVVNDSARIAALEANGFVCEGTIPQGKRVRDHFVDVQMWAKLA